MLFEARGYFLPQMMKIPWDFWLIFAVLGVLIPWRGAVRVRRLLRLPQITPMIRLTIYARTIAFQWLLSAVVAWRCYARGLTAIDLGLAISSPAKTAATAVSLLFFVGTIQYIGISRLNSIDASPSSRYRQISALLFPHSLIEGLAFLPFAMTAAVCEEFFFRGFVFAVLLSATHLIAIAVVGSSFLFSFGHLYQGKRGMVSALILGVILGASRAWAGNLVPAITLHLMVDLMVGLLVPLYLKRKTAPATKDQ
jgi:membrane protease YdiL (CAAX protease family)